MWPSARQTQHSVAERRLSILELISIYPPRRIAIRQLWLAVALATLGAAAIACTSSGTAPDGAEPTMTASPSQTVAPTATAAVPNVQVLRLVIAVTDLAVGPGNRLAFALIGPEGPVQAPTAAVQIQPLGDLGGEMIRKGAVFRPWPVSPGGVFSTFVAFEHAGQWGVEARVFLPGGATGVGRAEVSVATASASPALGTVPPASRNKTSAEFDDPTDPEELATITSSPDPDPELYRLTVAEAIESGLPTVVSFSTPAFCRTGTCGPQVEVLSTLRERHAGKANFIHIEVYDSPHTVLDISRARLVPQMEEWGLRSEPFTFVLDREGRVAVKFESFVNADELGAALEALLDS